MPSLLASLRQYALLLVLSLMLVSTVTASSSLLTLDVKNDGSFTILINNEPWFPSSNSIINVNGSVVSMALISSSTTEGKHAHLGDYKDYIFNYNLNNVNKTPLNHLLRVYPSMSSVEFTTVFPLGLNDTAIDNKDGVCVSLSSLRITNEGSPSPLGFASFNDNMIKDASLRWGKWTSTPSDWSLIRGGLAGSLLTVFNENNTAAVMISASSQFMASNFYISNSTLYMGVMGAVTTIPIGYSTSFVVSASTSPVAAILRWGNVLGLKHYNKNPRNAAADIALQYVGYSTDNGAYYYYHSMNDVGRWKMENDMEPTLLAVKQYADSVEIPYQYILLDSWWYPKSPVARDNGVITWDALPSVFPSGMTSTWKNTGWLIQGHNRYWSSDTSYASLNNGPYNFIVERENRRAIPDDQQFWDDLMRNSTQWGLRVYEQDWLHNEFIEMNATLTSATLASTWLTQMASAAAKVGITIQYCMAYPRHILQSIELPAVTQFRASDDYHPGNSQWKLSVSSLLARALRLSPSKDNYWSTEIQPLNNYNGTEPNSQLQSAISSLTTGPVAVGDAVNRSDSGLIMRCCNKDGLLLKPDVPSHAINALFLSRVFGGSTNLLDGELTTTFTCIGSYCYQVVLAADMTAPFQLLPSDLENVSSHSVAIRRPTNANTLSSLETRVFDSTHPITIPLCGTRDFVMYYISPVFSNGWILIGEIEKWIAISNQRISELTLSASGVAVSVRGAKSETVTLWFQSPNGAVFSVICTIRKDDNTATFTVPEQLCS